VLPIAKWSMAYNCLAILPNSYYFVKLPDKTPTICNPALRKSSLDGNVKTMHPQQGQKDIISEAKYLLVLSFNLPPTPLKKIS
jgi:hypothetical protein